MSDLPPNQLGILAWVQADDEYPDGDSPEFFHAVLGNALVNLLNPPDDDAGFESILVDALVGAVEFIEAQPCTCTDESCDRCAAIGRYRDERIGR